MRKKVVQQGRSERRGESYSVPYVEPLSDARTPLADFFRILLDDRVAGGHGYMDLAQVPTEYSVP
jgi:hypothetical protein